MAPEYSPRETQTTSPQMKQIGDPELWPQPTNCMGPQRHIKCGLPSSQHRWGREPPVEGVAVRMGSQLRAGWGPGALAQGSGDEPYWRRTSGPVSCEFLEDSGVPDSFSGCCCPGHLPSTPTLLSACRGCGHISVLALTCLAQPLHPPRVPTASQGPYSPPAPNVHTLL